MMAKIILRADIAAVEAAKLIVERAARGIQEATPEVRALARAKRVGADMYAPDAFEVEFDEDEGLAS